MIYSLGAAAASDSSMLAATQSFIYLQEGVSQYVDRRLVGMAARCRRRNNCKVCSYLRSKKEVGISTTDRDVVRSTQNKHGKSARWMKSNHRYANGRNCTKLEQKRASSAGG